MPNLDGGHYFLTVLAPIRVDLIVDKIPGRSRSHRHQLAQKLALLATGRQTAASPPDAWPSPFAANTLNHLARFVIIGGPPYNGRLSGDTLLGVLRDINPLTPQPVDRLSVPYLLFAADIDAPGDGGRRAARLHRHALGDDERRSGGDLRPLRRLRRRRHGGKILRLYPQVPGRDHDAIQRLLAGRASGRGRDAADHAVETGRDRGRLARLRCGWWRWC